MLMITCCVLIGMTFSARASLQQTVDQLEEKVESLEEQLEYGGKQYQSIIYSESTMSATISLSHVL